MRSRIFIALVAAGLTCSATTTPAKKPAGKQSSAKPPATATKETAASAPKKSMAAGQDKTSAPAPRSRRVTHAAQKTPAHPPAAKWRTAQQTPTPDRYREIQEALAKKGYLHGEPSGVWNQDSTDALRHFQQDQNLQVSGKLDSLSIIALGLGPKH